MSAKRISLLLPTRRSRTPSPVSSPLPATNSAHSLCLSTIEHNDNQTRMLAAQQQDVSAPTNALAQSTPSLTPPPPSQCASSPTSCTRLSRNNTINHTAVKGSTFCGGSVGALGRVMRSGSTVFCNATRSPRQRQRDGPPNLAGNDSCRSSRTGSSVSTVSCNGRSGAGVVLRTPPSSAIPSSPPPASHLFSLSGGTTSPAGIPLLPRRLSPIGSPTTQHRMAFSCVALPASTPPTHDTAMLDTPFPFPSCVPLDPVGPIEVSASPDAGAAHETRAGSSGVSSAANTRASSSPATPATASQVVDTCTSNSCSSPYSSRYSCAGSHSGDSNTQPDATDGALVPAALRDSPPAEEGFNMCRLSSATDLGDHPRNDSNTTNPFGDGTVRAAEGASVTNVAGSIRSIPSQCKEPVAADRIRLSSPPQHVKPSAYRLAETLLQIKGTDENLISLSDVAPPNCQSTGRSCSSSSSSSCSSPSHSPSYRTPYGCGGGGAYGYGRSSHDAIVTQRGMAVLRGMAKDGPHRGSKMRLGTGEGSDGSTSTATVPVYSPTRHAGDDAAVMMIQLLTAAFDVRCEAMRFTDTSRSQLKRLLIIVCDALLAAPREPLIVHRQSPLMVCGDLHGSYADLSYLLGQVTPFRCPKFLSTGLLFLGDYVDRGAHSVEVVALLFAWKVLNPSKVLLLRGNHEDPEVNGDVSQYSSGSFLHKCIGLFGGGGRSPKAPNAGEGGAAAMSVVSEEGPEVWARINTVFARLPIAAVIDDSIFACHGGIPRLHYPVDELRKAWSPPMAGPGGGRHDDACPREASTCGPLPPPHPHAIPSSLFDQLLEKEAPLMPPIFTTVMPVADDTAEMAVMRRLQRELLWNDPISDDGGPSREPSPSAPGDGYGFRPNVGRGDHEGVILEFDQRAITAFLSHYKWSLVLRAHQHKRGGLQLTNSAKVVTVFTSANYAGEPDAAGACLVADGAVRLVSWDRAATVANAPPRHHHDEGASGRYSSPLSPSSGFCGSSAGSSKNSSPKRYATVHQPAPSDEGGIGEEESMPPPIVFSPPFGHGRQGGLACRSSRAAGAEDVVTIDSEDILGQFATITSDTLKAQAVMGRGDGTERMPMGIAKSSSPEANYCHMARGGGFPAASSSSAAVRRPSMDWYSGMLPADFLASGRCSRNGSFRGGVAMGEPPFGVGGGYDAGVVESTQHLIDDRLREGAVPAGAAPPHAVEAAVASADFPSRDGGLGDETNYRTCICPLGGASLRLTAFMGTVSASIGLGGGGLPHRQHYGGDVGGTDAGTHCGAPRPRHCQRLVLEPPAAAAAAADGSHCDEAEGHAAPLLTAGGGGSRPLAHGYRPLAMDAPSLSAAHSAAMSLRAPVGGGARLSPPQPMAASSSTHTTRRAQSAGAAPTSSSRTRRVRSTKCG